MYRGSRLERDEQTIRRIAPRTSFRESRGIRVFVESIESELGDNYILGYTFDGSEYQAYVISPTDIAGKCNVNTCHLWPDGKICLSMLPNYGMHDIAGARSRAILWCTGYSIFQRTRNFPF